MSNEFSDPAKDLLPPVDDGAASHLEAASFPDLALTCTAGKDVNIAGLSGLTVLYVYPMTGRPGVALPEDWDEIPGARGCSPQACSFRDHYTELQSLHAGVYGLSAQTIAYQTEARDRLQLPYQLLSDSTLQLKQLLQLPTFTTSGMELYKRLTLIVDNGRIKQVFYPVFPPERNADDVLNWLQQNS